MLSFNLIVTICLLYVGVLFAIAALAERRAQQGKLGLLKSPIVYTLSISVYCTAWTYYGSVGSAARNGFEFLAIYLGPTLVFVGWWWFLRKLVRIGRTQRITSIADLVSSRFGKSNGLAVFVTLLAIVGSTPYIALQLQSLTIGLSVFTVGTTNQASPLFTALLIALGLAAFTIVFGTRTVDANERHYGVVTAIAVEAIVKLIAFIAVGIFVVWGVSGGLSDTFALMEQELAQHDKIFTPRWITLTFLSASAIICLPRMFQVIVVENSAERHLATASWAFPLYLLLMCVFVLPIAATGLNILPEGANPDLFVLSIPLAENQSSLAALAFLGGFSSATSMVIVAAIALSTMVSNHIVLPVWLYASKNRNPESNDVRTVLLRSRRISIGFILAFGYLYFSLSGGTSELASIGLIAFLGVAQVLPALIGGLFWHNATRTGAFWGMGIGFVVWAYTLFLPSFGASHILSQSVLDQGLFGLSFLRPQSLFGITIEDSLIHAVFWSMILNSVFFIGASLVTVPSPLERLQARRIIGVYGNLSRSSRVNETTTAVELFVLAQRILGRNDAKVLFDKYLGSSDQGGLPPLVDADFMDVLEREFAGSVGAATAHSMINHAVGGEAISVEDLIAVADETVQVIEYSTKLEEQSKELTETADALRAANKKLTVLGSQKDDFLSQVSHELRTPMTSIRSFSEILKTSTDLDEEKLNHFATVISDEGKRITRLLDEILDLSFLESGRVQLNLRSLSIREVIAGAIRSTQQITQNSNTKITIGGAALDKIVETDVDRLSQVFINLITNAVKYSDKDVPLINIDAAQNENRIEISVKDNGPGIAPENRELVFEKFAQLPTTASAGGVGLGLAISREIMKNLGGKLDNLQRQSGAAFVVTI